MATNSELYGINNQWNPDQSTKSYKPYTKDELAEKYGELYTAGADTRSAGRTALAGTSGADESLLSDGEYAILQQLREQFAAAQAAGDKAGMDAAHEEGERIRASHGYSGGADGSQFIAVDSVASKSTQNTAADTRPVSSGSAGKKSAVKAESTLAGAQVPSAPEIKSTPRYSSDTTALKSMLEQWKAQAVEQKKLAVDRAVEKAVAALEQALEDAQPQFLAQAESVSRDERQSMDNAALYAELRGDRGGIGRSQYEAIQAAAAQNRLAVQQAQTRLATDTARQIADLRAQGEFEKADAALSISQTYLSRLTDLEKWAQEFDLSAAQFDTSLQKWKADYELSLAKLRTDIAQSDRSARLAAASAENSRASGMRTQLASMGKALLEAGILPGEAQLDAMGLTEEQALAYIRAMGKN